MSDTRIDIDRLRDDIHALAKIGSDEPSHGITRPAFSDADMEARQWLLNRMTAAGGTARIDEAGNIIGRFEGKQDGAALVLGSHIDTVPSGGMLDGALGVLAGLECARTAQHHGEILSRPLEVVAFTDEEGRFGGMFGAQAFCGKLTPEAIHSSCDVDGVRLVDVLETRGLEPLSVLKAMRQPESIHAFLELHIEQGPVLEAEGLSIGIVEAISGVFKWVVRLVGKANHAGTAPMDYRSDAFMGLADFAHEIPRIIDEDGTSFSRLTVGKAELKPGYPHTVPGEVEFSLVGRDLSAEAMRELSHSCRKVLSTLARRHHLYFEFDEHSWLDPFPCHDDIIAAFRRHAEQMKIGYKVMPSGAGHDTQFLAEVTRAGMIFVPSVGGVSHAPDEWTNWSDIEIGADLLYKTARSFLGT